MRFWDTSGLVPLLLDQEASALVHDLFTADADVVAWWGTPVEISSAAARLRRAAVLSVADEGQVLSLLAALQESWIEIVPSEEVRQQARRLLRVHPLRVADALQLAAALVWAGPSSGAEVVTFDERLMLAARLEGFTIAP